MERHRSFARTGFLISGLFAAAVVSADHSWANYHWARSADPLPLDLGDNVDGRWDPYRIVATTDWDASSVLTLSTVNGSTRPRQCRTKNGTVQICNEAYGFNGWLGIAGIAVSGDHITAAYVKVNDSYYDSPTYDTPEWRQFVMCQEIGHAFGLGHQDENFSNANLGSCMDYTSDPSTNQHPNTHDYALLEQIYAHSHGGGGTDDGGDSSGCNPRSPKCNGASAADILNQLDMNAPAQWGRLVSQRGIHAIYELDLGSGRRIITHVTWTLERAARHGASGDHDHEHDH